MTRLLDSCVRVAINENPEAARALINEYDNFPGHAHKWAELKHMPWAEFVHRVRDLHRGPAE